MPLRLYNTLTKRVEDFVPRNPSDISFYTCGPTVYDDAHIGNFRSFLAADLLRRWVESLLCEIADGKGGSHKGARKDTHVMNITDVGHMTDDAEGGEAGEDRMAVAGRRIAEAKKAGKLPADAKVDPSDPYQIAKFYEGRFKEDSRSLGLKLVLDADKDPSLTPRATDNIDGMKLVIETLLAKGFAYPAGNPGARVVYFDVQKFAPYGRLSGNTLDKLREGEGGRISGENQSQKRHPADFLLWKEDPSHVMKWPSPASLTGWGMGYPGWHIECTVMSVGRLLSLDAADRASGRVLSEALAKGLPNGDSLIDLHSGGEDNIFPHHECELAQSCCAFNQSPAQGTFSRLWFHPRFLFVEGAKMSKSKGNFFTARDLFAKGYEPAAVRLELIRTHYRSNADFREQGLKDCQRMLNRWSGRLGQLAAAMTKASSNNWAIAEERVELHAKDFADSLAPTQRARLGVFAMDEEAPLPARPEPVAISPIQDLDELIEAFSAVLENEEPPGEIERVLDGVARLCATKPDRFSGLAAPLIARAAKLPGAVLSPLLMAWTRGTTREPTPAFASLMTFLSARVQEVAERAMAGRAAPLVGVPSHSGGWLDPLVFVERLRANRTPDPLDFIQGLLRLSPANRREALAAASRLPGEIGKAVRYALGAGKVLAQPVSDPLWTAASQARDPGWGVWAAWRRRA